MARHYCQLRARPTVPAPPITASPQSIYRTAKQCICTDAKLLCTMQQVAEIVEAKSLLCRFYIESASWYYGADKLVLYRPIGQSTLLVVEHVQPFAELTMHLSEQESKLVHAAQCSCTLHSEPENLHCRLVGDYCAVLQQLGRSVGLLVKYHSSQPAPSSSVMSICVLQCKAHCAVQSLN